MGNASIIIMSGSDKRLFWTILMSWSVSRCKDKMRKGWGRKNFCVSKYESYEPVWPSSPLQACLYLSAGFCLLQCKVGLWGFGSANKNTTKPPPPTQQLTSKTTHATGREKKQGTEPFFACLEKLIIALPWLWKARAMSPAQPNKLKPGGNMFLQVLKLTTSALPNIKVSIQQQALKNGGLLHSVCLHPCVQAHPWTLKTSPRSNKKRHLHDSSPLME